MKYCTKCGAELMDEAVVCPKCGCGVDKQRLQKVQGQNEVTNESYCPYKFATTFIQLCVICFVTGIVCFLGTNYVWMNCFSFIVSLLCFIATTVLLTYACNKQWAEYLIGSKAISLEIDKWYALSSAGVLFAVFSITFF